MVPGQGTCDEPPRGGLEREKKNSIFFSPVGILRDFLTLLVSEKNSIMGFRRATEGNIHCVLILEVYHHPEQHKIQATRVCWTQIQMSKTLWSGQR